MLLQHRFYPYISLCIDGNWQIYLKCKENTGFIMHRCEICTTVVNTDQDTLQLKRALYVVVINHPS